MWLWSPPVDMGSFQRTGERGACRCLWLVTGQTPIHAFSRCRKHRFVLVLVPRPARDLPARERHNSELQSPPAGNRGDDNNQQPKSPKRPSPRKRAHWHTCWFQGQFSFCGAQHNRVSVTCVGARGHCLGFTDMFYDIRACGKLYCHGLPSRGNSKLLAQHAWNDTTLC